ncbi:unnamed protein product [Discosporangium mesarthrocarpum]
MVTTTAQLAAGGHVAESNSVTRPLELEKEVKNSALTSKGKGAGLSNGERTQGKGKSHAGRVEMVSRSSTSKGPASAVKEGKKQSRNEGLGAPGSGSQGKLDGMPGQEEPMTKKFKVPPGGRGRGHGNTRISGGTAHPSLKNATAEESKHVGVREPTRTKRNDLNLAFQAQKAEKALEASAQGEGRERRGRAGLQGSRGGDRRRNKKETLSEEEKSRYVSMDCEMVGVGHDGKRSVLARCCIVDWEGIVLYDKHVAPCERVTDFRTFVSGVKAKHLREGIPLRQCQSEVAALLKDKILVGHALQNDLKASKIAVVECF